MNFQKIEFKFVTVGIDLLQGKLSFFGGPAFNFISDYITGEQWKSINCWFIWKSLVTLQYGMSLNFGNSAWF